MEGNTLRNMIKPQQEPGCSRPHEREGTSRLARRTRGTVRRKGKAVTGIFFSRLRQYTTRLDAHAGIYTLSHLMLGSHA